MYDEVFFHSVTTAVMETGKYTLTAAPDLYQHEILFYGPVYFQVQAFIMKFLGTGIWQFRLLNMLCGFGVLGIIALLLKHFGVPKKAILLAVLFLLLENVFGQVLHSARMDFVALFLILGGIYSTLIAIKQTKDQAKWLYQLAGALLVGLALITTPRIVFLLPLYALVLLSTANYRSIAVLLVVAFSPLAYWVFIRVGFSDYLAMFQHPVIAGHIGSGFGLSSLFRQWYNVPLVLFWLWTLVRFIRSKVEDATKRYFLIGLHASIVLFVVLIKEQAPYSAMLNAMLVLCITTSHVLIPTPSSATINHSTTHHSTIQPHNHLTIQPLNHLTTHHSTTQPLNHSTTHHSTTPNPSSILPNLSSPTINHSTIQPHNHLTTQPLNHSTILHLSSLILLSLPIFTAKTIALGYTWQERNPESTAAQIMHIDQKKVYADPQFYYALRERGIAFEFLQYYEGKPERNQTLIGQKAIPSNHKYAFLTTLFTYPQAEVYEGRSVAESELSKITVN